MFNSQNYDFDTENMSSEEIEIFNNLVTGTLNPLTMSEVDYNKFIDTMLKIRKSKLENERSILRTRVAKEEGWKFAMDGGFMQNGNKAFVTGGSMFAKIYQRYDSN